jgi:hypothetical protein
MPNKMTTTRSDSPVEEHGVTEARTFTAWFVIHVDGSPAEIQAEASRAEAARRVAETLGHEFEESDPEIRTARDFGYKAPVTAVEQVFAALAEARALDRNAVYADEDLSTVDPAAQAALEAAELRFDLCLTIY